MKSTVLFSLILVFSLITQAQVNTRTWKIYKSGWSDGDQAKYAEFVRAIGDSGCRSINACLKSPSNPYRGSDRGSESFRSDCADLPYTLLGYFAWKNGLPFAYSTAMKARGGKGDIRYSKDGNVVSTRMDLTSKKLGNQTGVNILNTLVDYVSTAMFRTGPDVDLDDRGIGSDFYPIRISKASVRAGTAFYDPSGHVAVVYKVGADGRVYMIDAHPDQSITRVMFGEKFGNSRATHGSGFKSYRPVRLVGAQRANDGSLTGGKMVSIANRNLPNFSKEQYLSANWKSKKWSIDGVASDFYSYARVKLADGNLKFQPVDEMRAMMRGMCSDFQDRVLAVQVAVQKGMHNQANPDRLPKNIYGTDGDWEEYSTPSRDARLKTAAVELRTTMERLVGMVSERDPRIIYDGHDLKGDLLNAYQEEAANCQVTYVNSRGDSVALTYEKLISRLFATTFDPYHCPELRWGAGMRSGEFSSCRDPDWDLQWYAAEQGLRNQIDRTYDARMDFNLQALRNRAPGTGPQDAPDVDLHSYLESF
jgi:hypothetical protein